VFDMTVPVAQTYTAAGVINHNTLAGAAEVAMHLTGLYPSWWQGRRWERPCHWWVAGETQETTRDSVQRMLIGPPSEQEKWGTGLVPGKNIAQKPSMQGGTQNAIDTVVVSHASGGKSELSFKSYGRGREKWQAVTIDGVWMDEEPRADVYTEALTRTHARDGLVMITFTPLLGMSDVVRMYLDESAERQAA
jgi:phage terminase large subunit-like protein